MTRATDQQNRVAHMANQTFLSLGVLVEAIVRRLAEKRGG